MVSGPSTAESEAEFEPPATAIEQLLASIWSDVLDLTPISRHDNFFALGGHSLLLASVIKRLEKDTGKTLDPTHFAFNSLAVVADLLQKQDESRKGRRGWIARLIGRSN